MSSAADTAPVDDAAAADDTAAADTAPTGPARATPSPTAPPRDRWWLVISAALLSFVIMLDMNIVNLALPTIAGSLRVEPSVAQWVRLGYLLPLIATVLPSGRWLDRIGRRPALIVGVGGFAAAGVCATFAPTIEALITARVLQGLAGAILYALGPTLATIAVRPQARARAMSVLTTLGPIGAMCGPTIGGVLLETIGWRAVFAIPIPVCLLAVAIGVRSLSGAARDGDRDPAGWRLRPPGSGWVVDTVLLGGAIGAVLLALNAAGAHDLVGTAIAAAALPLLLLWRRRPQSLPVRRILSGHGMRGLHTTVLGFALGFAAVHLLMPFYLQGVLGVGAFATGMTMLAIPAGMTLASPLGGCLGDRLGGSRAGVAGALVAAVGLGLLVPLPVAGWTAVDVGWRLGLVGLGLGLYGGPTQALTMSGAPPGLISTTAGTVQLARTLGFALGPAVATAVWAGGDYSTAGMRAAVALAVVVNCLAVVPLIPLWRTRSLRGGEDRRDGDRATPSTR